MTMEIREINNYTISAAVTETTVEFEILDSCSSDCGTGSVKWDGCSNWNLNIHFCGKDETIMFGKLMSELYVWASELLPEYAENILED